MPGIEIHTRPFCFRQAVSQLRGTITTDIIVRCCMGIL